MYNFKDTGVIKFLSKVSEHVLGDISFQLWFDLLLVLY